MIFFLLFTLVIAAGGLDICEYQRCNSYQNQFKRCPVNDARQVLNVTIAMEKSEFQCNDTTFGFVAGDIWVSRGCRAKFTVCYIEGKLTPCL